MSKTTLTGLLTIAGGVITFVVWGLAHGNFTDVAAWSTLLGAVSAGIGLIKAADAPTQ